MPVTIKDVAALAGVSPSTVSRTCKDHPSISRQTKEKVRQAMAKLGYEPNFRHPSGRLTRMRFIWKSSAASASTVIRNNISIQWLQARTRMRY